MCERALVPGYVKLPPSTVGIGGPLVSLLPFLPAVLWTFVKGSIIGWAGPETRVGP